MQYSQEHLKTMVYAEFGGKTECIMGNSKIENAKWGAFIRENDLYSLFSLSRCTENSNRANSLEALLTFLGG